jgi:hypothetical protein
MAIDVSKYLKTSNQVFTDGQKSFRISGPKKHGKTFFAGTASKFWPTDLDAKEPVDLTDLFWIACDNGALNGFNQYNLNVPNMLNMNEVLREVPLPKAVDVVKAAGMAAYEKGAEILVFDTISVFDSDIITYWSGRIREKEDGSIDNNTLYRNVLATHRKMETLCRQLPFKYVIWLCHLKYEAEVRTYDAKEKKKALQKKSAVDAPGGGQLIPAITGQARDMVYGANVDLDGVLFATQPPGGKEYIRKLYTQPDAGKGFSASNRYANRLEPVEQANLRQIINKVEGKNNV